MDAVTGQDQQALLAQLAQAREKLDGLVRDLRAVDRELEDLATERQQHRLLHDVCGALEELGEIGGAGLFWGDRTAAGTSEDHIRRVRSRVDVFEKRVSEIEDRRQAVLEELERQADDTDLLENDLLEAQEEEERREQEWIIEREIGDLPVSHADHAVDARRRGRPALPPVARTSVLCSLLFALVDSPDRSAPARAREEPIEVPERVVRLMMKARPLPPPAAREETRPQVPEESRCSPRLRPRRRRSRTKDPARARARARRRDRARGFSPSGRSSPWQRTRVAGPARLAGADHQCRVRRRASSERSMVTSHGAGLERRDQPRRAEPRCRRPAAVAAARSRASRSRAWRARSAAAGTGAPAAARATARARAAAPALGRTDEEIQIVFDRHKSALYRLYNRELRSDPTLKGQMVLRMRIEPDGSVSLCELQGTDMKAPQLVGAGRRTREDVRLRRQRRHLGGHDSLSDRFPAGDLSRIRSIGEPRGDWPNHVRRLDRSSRQARRDSEKGKTTERWRRKVSGLQGLGPTTAGPPESSRGLRVPSVRTGKAIASGGVTRGDD